MERDGQTNKSIVHQIMIRVTEKKIQSKLEGSDGQLSTLVAPEVLPMGSYTIVEM